MAVITITRNDVRDALYAESTNAARTMMRQDGVSLTNDFVIDEQADQSLNGAWLEAGSKLSEKLHEFTTTQEVGEDNIRFDFIASQVQDGVYINIKQYVVDYMMADWLASVRPEYRQRYIDRANFELDDLLRKLYKREEPI